MGSLAPQGQFISASDCLTEEQNYDDAATSKFLYQSRAGVGLLAPTSY